LPETVLKFPNETVLKTDCAFSLFPKQARMISNIFTVQ